MGFMKGLASGFADSFNAAENHRQAAKQDAFRVAYDQFSRNQTKYDADKAKDEALIKAAKGVQRSVPGAPEGAWEYAYQWLSGGMSYENALKQMKSTTFAATAQPSMPDTIPTPSTGLLPGVGEAQQAEMQQGALGQDATAQPAATGVDPQAAQDQPTGPLDYLFGDKGLLNPGAVKERSMQQAQDNVRNTAGLDEQTFGDINAGYKPYEPSGDLQVTNIADANGDPLKQTEAWIYSVKGADGIVRPIAGEMRNGQLYDGANNPVKGEIIGTPKNNTMQSDFNDLRKQIDTDLAPLREQRSTTTSFISTIKGLSDQAAHNPAVLARVSAVSTFMNEAGNEANALFQQVIGAPGSGSVTEEQIVAAERATLDQINKRLAQQGNTASDVQVFAAQFVQAKFQLARLLNGAGTLAQKDVDAAGDALLNTNDPAIFADTSRNLAKKMADSFDTHAGVIGKTLQSVKQAPSYDIDTTADFTPLRDTLDVETQRWLENKEAPAKEGVKAGVSMIGDESAQIAANAKDKKDHTSGEFNKQVDEAIAGSTAQPKWEGVPDEYNGMIYLGGDPNDQKNWKKK